MKKLTLALLAVLFVAIGPESLCAQADPELDLIRGLRKRGWSDLALQRLQLLQARTQPPLSAELKQILPLEIAKTQAALAHLMEDASERDRLIEKVRKDLDAFVKNAANKANPALADAWYDLARITADQASAKAAESRHGAEAQRQLDKQQAITQYAAADSAFREALKLLEERAKKVEDSKNVAERQAALEAHVEALFQHGLITYQLSEVHGSDLKGGEALRASSKAFDSLGAYRLKPDGGPNVVALGWQGLAWYGRTMMELDQNKGTATYQAIERERRPEASVAQRLVRYFRFVSDFKSPAPPAVRNKSVADGEKWLKDYPAAAHSAEGQHVRFLLGLLYLDELEEVKDIRQKKTPAFEGLVNKATNHLNDLEKSSSRYGSIAMSLKLRVRYVSGKAISTPIAQLNSFEDCLLRADYEYREGLDTDKKAKAAEGEEEKKSLEAKTRTHFTDMMATARRALDMMPENVKEDQWERANGFLFFGYTHFGDPYRASIIMEHLARTTKNPENAQKRAVAALRMYQTIANEKQDPYARQQLVALAMMMEQRWPQATETETARDILGFDLLRNKKYREGAAMLAKVSDKYAGFPKTSYWAGRIHWNLHFQVMREAKKSINSPSPDRDQSIQLLNRCIKAAGAVKSDANAVLAVQARVGLAEIHSQLGEADRVLELVGPLVSDVEANKLPKDVEQGTGTQILGLALRTQIQKKDVEAAVKVLNILQKQGSAEDIGKGLKEHLLALGQQFKVEIDTQADPDRLQDLKNSFRQFLVHLEKDPKLPTDLVLWVGSNYSLIDDYLKAAEVFARVNASTPAGHEQHNLSAQLLYHAALRQAAANADKAKKEELFKRADAELTKIMKDHEKIRKHPAFVKETIHLKQERGFYSGSNGAIVGWDKLRQALEPHIERSAQFKQIYLDASYYLVWCLYQEARLIQNPAVKKEAMDRAAQKLRAFQQIDDLKPRFDELLGNGAHKDLKEAYGRIGRAAAK